MLTRDDGSDVIIGLLDEPQRSTYRRWPGGFLERQRGRRGSLESSAARGLAVNARRAAKSASRTMGSPPGTPEIERDTPRTYALIVRPDARSRRVPGKRRCAPGASSPVARPAHRGHPAKTCRQRHLSSGWTLAALVSGSQPVDRLNRLKVAGAGRRRCARSSLHRAAQRPVANRRSRSNSDQRLDVGLEQLSSSAPGRCGTVAGHLDAVAETVRVGELVGGC